MITRDEKLKMYNNMKKYGGGFISSLAEAIIRADQTNLEKLQKAFPDEFKKYLEIN